MCYSEWLTEQQQLKKAQKQERDEIFGRIASSRVAEMPKFSEPIPNFESTETEHVDSSTEMSNDVKYNQVFESTDNVVNESVAQPKAIANIQPTEMTSIPVMVTKLM